VTEPIFVQIFFYFEKRIICYIFLHNNYLTKHLYIPIANKYTHISRSRDQLVLKQVYIQKTFLCHACLYCIYVLTFSLLSI